MLLEPTDLFTSIEVAAGYDVLESDMRTSVSQFLGQAHTVEELAAQFESVSLRPNVISVSKDIDISPFLERDELVEFSRRTCEVAQAITCPNIGVVSGVAPTRIGPPFARRQQEGCAR